MSPHCFLVAVAGAPQGEQTPEKSAEVAPLHSMRSDSDSDGGGRPEDLGEAAMVDAMAGAMQGFATPAGKKTRSGRGNLPAAPFTPLPSRPPAQSTQELGSMVTPTFSLPTTAPSISAKVSRLGGVVRATSGSGISGSVSADGITIKMPGTKQALRVSNAAEGLLAMMALAELNMSGNSLVEEERSHRHQRERSAWKARVKRLEAALATARKEAKANAAAAERYRNGGHRRTSKAMEEGAALQRAARDVNSHHNNGATALRDAALAALPGVDKPINKNAAKEISSGMAQVAFSKGGGATTREGVAKWLRRGDVRWLLPTEVRDALDGASVQSDMWEHLKKSLNLLKLPKGGTLRTAQHNAREATLASVVPPSLRNSGLETKAARALGQCRDAIRRAANRSKVMHDEELWEAVERGEYSNALPRKAKWMIWQWWLDPDCPASRIDNGNKHRCKAYTPDQIDAMDDGKQPSLKDVQYKPRMLQTGSDNDALASFKETKQYKEVRPPPPPPPYHVRTTATMPVLSWRHAIVVCNSRQVLGLTTSTKRPHGIELGAKLFIMYRPGNVRKFNRHSITGHCVCTTCTEAITMVEQWGRCRSGWYQHAEKVAATCPQAADTSDTTDALVPSVGRGTAGPLPPEATQPEACGDCDRACHRDSAYRTVHRGGLLNVIKSSFCAPKPLPALDLPGAPPFRLRDRECSNGQHRECGFEARFTAKCPVEWNAEKSMVWREFDDVCRGKNKDGKELYQTEFVPKTGTRAQFMAKLIEKVSLYEAHMHDVRFQGQTERLWEQHKQFHQLTIVADFGAALVHPREFVPTCAFEEKSTHSVIVAGHSPSVVVDQVEEEASAGSTQPKRKVFRPHITLDHREAVRAISPAALGAASRAGATGPAAEQLAGLAAAAAKIQSLVQGSFARAATQELAAQAERLRAATSALKSVAGASDHVVARLAEAESAFKQLREGFSRHSQLSTQLTSKQAGRVMTLAGLCRTKARAVIAEVQRCAGQVAPGDGGWHRRRHPGSVHAQPLPKLVRTQIVDVWFLLTKLKGDAVTFVHHLEDVIAFYKTGAVVHAEWFQGGERLPGADHTKPLPEELSEWRAKGGGAEVEQDGDAVAEQAAVAPMDVEERPHADAPHITEATLFTDGCRKQYDCARWLLALAKQFEQFGMKMRQVKHPPMHGKHSADGYSNVPKNIMHDTKIRQLKTADTGSRPLVLHVAMNCKGPRGHDLSAWWGARRYFQGHLNADRIDPKVAGNAQTVDGCTKYHERTAIPGGVNGEPALMLRGLHCKCGPCREGDVAKCECKSIVGEPIIKPVVPKAEDSASAAGFSRPQRQRKERNEKEESGLFVFFAQISVEKPALVALRVERKDRQGDEKYWLAKPLGLAYELEKPRLSGEEIGNNLGEGYWVIDVKYYQLQKTVGGKHYYVDAPAKYSNLTVSVSALIYLTTLKFPPRRKGNKRYVLSAAQHQQIMQVGGIKA